MIERQGGIQWPYPSGTEYLAQERRLFEDEKYYHQDGKAKFFFEPLRPAPEERNEEFPYVLLTGRGSVAQWHTQTRTGKVEMLRKMYPEEAYLEIHPNDAGRLEIKSGDWVTVSSRRGEIKARAAVGDSVNPGELFMPMHYVETNNLTYPAFDPYSREPSYKYAAVNIKPQC